MPLTREFPSAVPRRHGPQFPEKITRRFISHHMRLVDQGFTQSQAYDMVKEALVTQYRQFEARHAKVFAAGERASLVRHTPHPTTQPCRVE